MRDRRRSGASSGQAEATEFFTAAARNLQQAGERVSVARIIVVSIIGCDRFSAGYNAAKAVHEQVMQAGPVPVTILRAAQFHEFVSQLVDWCTQGEVSYLPKMRTQLVAALTVAEAAADLATGVEWPLALGQPGSRSSRLLGNARRTSLRWEHSSPGGAASPCARRGGKRPRRP